MKVVIFSYRGRFAHFLRAEATANALTYPIPPRTVLLGLAGAILGMKKDTVQEVLVEARLAVGGALPERFWHKANMRKNLPAQLPRTVKKTDKGSSKAEKNTRIPQEWLWKPAFRVWAAFPDAIHDEFAGRIRDKRWHFSPCLGLSEMLADVEWAADESAKELPMGKHENFVCCSLGVCGSRCSENNQWRFGSASYSNASRRHNGASVHSCQLCS